MTPLAPHDDAGRSTRALLAGLRVVLHASFAALLALGLARALAGSPEAPPVRGTTAAALVALVLGLGGVYLAGTIHERRLWHAGRTPAPRAAAGWLALVLALWALAVLHHADLTWLAFPLFFVVLHVVTTLLGRPALAVVLVAAATAVVVGAGALRAGGPPPVGAVLGPVIGAGVAVVMYHAYRLLLAESERQRAVAEELRATRADLAASERHAGVLAERERLAREIHDTLTQGLASIVLVSRAAQDALGAGDSALADERLGTVRATAAESLAESRAFIRGLRASRGGAGDGLAGELVASLEAAVRAFGARQMAAGHPVRAEFEQVGRARDVTEAVGTVLVRAAQASLANVGQHAEASRCRVTLTWLDGEAALDVADDGRGFAVDVADAVGRPEWEADSAEEAAGTGVGLAGLRERVAAVGGSVEVESAPGEGTVVAVRVPVAAAPAAPLPAPGVGDRPADRPEDPAGGAEVTDQGDEERTMPR
ncbi:sensor histidine kinase [Micrococcus sp.]|uniref:sensor histidine kinase n=1 Tax=Micrococcus sp. TaxID=1271 RepID=UPI002A91062A|nr:ATP-binding protein [Micrococcus sp.]MDY6055279.1 histidine kinase [Micrococcus sp.]